MIPLLLLFIESFGLAAFGAPTPHARSLDDCFRAALQQSESVASQQELIFQAEERYKQAIGAVLPTINGIASYTKQDSVASSTGGSIFPTFQPMVRINATQPLFRGLREFAAIRQLKTLSEAQIEAKRQATNQLYNDIATNYFTILSLEQDLSNLKDEIGLSAQRIKELRDRVKIGRSRLSEVLTAESLQASLSAQVEQLQGQLSANRELFTFLTGLPQKTTLADQENSPNGLSQLDSYLQRLELRPDVQSAKYQTEAAENNVSIARGAHFPSVDLSGNYYFQRFGVLQDAKWDLNLTITLPIFSGGATQARVREAASQERVTTLALQRARRQADDEIRSIFQSLQADAAQVKALEKATELTEKNYKEQTREYRNGLVTNIDVLQALTSFQENKRALDRSKFNLKLDFIKMEVATAKKPEDRK